MKNFLIKNALNNKGAINGHFVKRLTIEQQTEIESLTSFCPDNTEIQIRIKFIINDTHEYPKCIVCGNNVRKHNKDLRLLETCSVNCDYQYRANLTKESNFKKYGVTSTNKLKNIKDKIKKTMLNNHGVESYTASNDFINKSKITKNYKYGNPTYVNPTKGKKTKLERYGDENYNNHEKYIETCVEKYGVEHVMQSKDIFEKQQLSCYGAKKYKHLYYRGTYELLFITEFEKRYPIEELQNCFAIKYEYNNKTKIYFPDFLVKNKKIIIEIKSPWTYDNNGKNEELRTINNKKWESAKSLNDYTFLPLKSKSEIMLWFELMDKKII
jgi:hypothetical protein